MSVPYRPDIYSPIDGNTELDQILMDNSIEKKDLLPRLLIELCLNLYPALPKDDDELIHKKIDEMVSEKKSRENGIWIYYPWLNLAIRILDKEDFVFLRTCRNREKITSEEYAKLTSKKIGIVGLSVGYSVLMTLSLERIVENIRIADFDHIELTNLNRIFQPLRNIGINKAISAARCVYEFDPYMEIEVFTDGLVVGNNFDEFFGKSKESELDLIVDECDSGAIKLGIRREARNRKLPVLMDTSDKSVLDIERYDLAPNYPLMHGMLEKYADCFEISDELSKQILLDTIDFTKASERGVYSMGLIGKSLRTWPQLGTDVLCGGVSVAMAAKKILLGEKVKSQRIYIDIESRIN